MSLDDDRRTRRSWTAKSASREYLELWTQLARREWNSIGIVPADPQGSTADIASALAEVGQRLSYTPVTAISLTSLEYGSALALADLQQHVARERRNGAVSAPAADGAAASEKAAAPVDDGAPAATAPVPGEPRSGALVRIPTARLIISVPSVLTDPLGLTVLEQADALVLAVRLNRSRLAEVRRTLEMVGRERVIGCYLVH